jgi:hypothetical protein
MCDIHRLEDSIVRITILKLTYEFNAIPTKIILVFNKNWQDDFEIYMENPQDLQDQKNLDKK